MHWLQGIRSNHPTVQTWKMRNIKDGIDVSAWRTPCVKRALPESLSNNGGRTRKGWQTDTQESARTRRPSLALPQRRRNERVRHQKITFLMCLCVNGLSKPTDDVGQQAKDNLRNVERQASAGMQYEFSAPYRGSIKPFKSFRVDADSTRKPKLTRLILRHAI